LLSAQETLSKKSIIFTLNQGFFKIFQTCDLTSKQWYPEPSPGSFQ